MASSSYAAATGKQSARPQGFDRLDISRLVDRYNLESGIEGGKMLSTDSAINSDPAHYAPALQGAFLVGSQPHKAAEHDGSFHRNDVSSQPPFAAPGGSGFPYAPLELLSSTILSVDPARHAADVANSPNFPSNSGRTLPISEERSKSFISPSGDAQPVAWPAVVAVPQPGSAQIYKYECPLCSNTFDRSLRVDACVNKHLKVKPHKCEGRCGTANCEKAYISVEVLRRHCSPPVERKTQCGSCLESILKQNFTRHQHTCRKVGRYTSGRRQ